MKPWELTLNEYFASPEAMKAVSGRYGLDSFIGYHSMIAEAYNIALDIPGNVRIQPDLKYIFIQKPTGIKFNL
jgi:hypothetical protein